MARTQRPIILPHGNVLRGAQTPEELDLSKFFPLCRKLANRYSGTLGSFDDAYQIAVEGLCRARDAWDPRRAPFGSVAPLYVRAELNTRAELAQKDAGTPKQERIIGKIHVRVGKAKPEERVVLIPGNAPATEDGSEIFDLLPDLSMPSPEAVAIENSERARAVERSRAALACLNPRARLIVKAHLLAEEPTSLADLGRELGISTTRARQIEVAALDRMRKLLTDPPAKPVGIPLKQPPKALAGEQPATAALPAKPLPPPRPPNVVETIREMLAAHFSHEAIYRTLIRNFPEREAPVLEATLLSQAKRWKREQSTALEPSPRGTQDQTTGVMDGEPRQILLNAAADPAAFTLENIMKKRIKKTSAPAKKPTAEKKPGGVIATIVETISGPKGASSEEIVAVLVKKFPDRKAEGMTNTVRIQANRNAAKKQKIDGRGLVYFGKAR